MPADPAPPADRLLDAVTAVLLEEGFEGISVRKVAARAEVSIGAVQHHFPTKDAMLQAAMDRASAAFQTELAQRVPADASPEDALRALLGALLTAGPDQRSTAVLWVARLARAAVHRPTAEAHAREWGQLAGVVAGLVGRVRPDLDAAEVDDAAAALLALVDGLAVTVLREPARMPPARAHRLLDRALGIALD